LFQAGRVSRPADDNVLVSCPADQVSLAPQNANGEAAATGEASNENSRTDALSVNEGKLEDSSNAVSTCPVSSSSSVSSVTVIATSNQQTNNSTTTCSSVQALKGVVIRPITTAPEASGKEY